MRNRKGSARGFTLTEVTLVVVFVSMFVMLLGGSILSGAAVSNESTVEAEVVAVANDALDAISGALYQAVDYSNAAADGSALTFRHGQDSNGDLALEPGIWQLVGGGSADAVSATFRDGFAYRARFLADGPGLVEAVAQVDLNGDGDLADTVATGRMVLEVLDVGGNVIPAMTRSFGGSRVHFVQNAFNGAQPVRIFSAAGAPQTALTVNGAGVGEGDPNAVQVNLTVVSRPFPTSGGGRTARVVRLGKVTARR